MNSYRVRPSPVVLNLTANFVSLGFIMASALVAMPLYLRILGAEAYGLVGFYTMLTATFQVLDVGLSQTLSRECARFRAGALDGQALRRMLGGFESIFGVVALAGMAAIVLAASPLAAHWLRPHQLGIREVATCVALMGVAVPAQWMGGLYRGAVNGLEHQVALSIFSIVIAALRYFGVFAALHAFGAPPAVFFAYQACISLLELAALAIVVRTLLVRPNAAGGSPSANIKLRGLLGFSAAIALASLTWIVQTQADKVILSRLLPLAEFGVFTLAVTGAAAITSVSAPFGQALLPRLTRLLAQGDNLGAIALYREATQLACLIALPPTVLLLLFAETIMWIWTGDRSVAAEAAPVLQAYVLGAGLLPISAFPYYLQYAHGRLRLHVMCQLVLLPFLVGGYGLMATRYGAIGTGWVWTAAVVGCVAIYAPIVHHRFAAKSTIRWFANDILPIAIASVACGALANWGLQISTDRTVAAAEILAVGCIALAASVAASSAARTRMKAACVALLPSA